MKIIPKITQATSICILLALGGCDWCSCVKKTNQTHDTTPAPKVVTPETHEAPVVAHPVTPPPAPEAKLGIPTEPKVVPFEPKTPMPFEPKAPTPIEPKAPMPFTPKAPTPLEPKAPTPFEPKAPTPFEPKAPMPIAPKI